MLLNLQFVTDISDTVRYLSLHDNKYLRYFKGHQQRLVSVGYRQRNTLKITNTFVFKYDPGGGNDFFRRLGNYINGFTCVPHEI